MVYVDCGARSGRTPAPAPDEPVFTRFTSSTPQTVQVNAMLPSSLTFSYAVRNNDMINTAGLTLFQGTTALAMNLAAGQMDMSGNLIDDSVVTTTATTTAHTFASAGNTVTFHMLGTTSDGSIVRSQDFTIRAQAPHQFAYYGVRPNNDFATVQLSDLMSDDITANNPFTVNQAFPNQSWFGLLVPATFDNTTISSIGADFTSAFTRTNDARTINNVQYNLYTLQNMSGQDNDRISYTIRVA